MITLRSVIEQLTTEGHLTPESAEEITLNITNSPVSSNFPWYIQAIIGVSAWIAAIPMIGFITTFTNIMGDKFGLMIIGFLYCLIAIVLRYAFPHQIFVTQATLATNLAGQMIFMGGLYQLTENTTTTIIAFMLIQLLMIAIYPDGVQRFISTMLTPLACVALLWEWEALQIIHLLILIVGAKLAVIWEFDTYLATFIPAHIYRPVAYGLAVSLMLLLTFWFNFVLDDPSLKIGNWWFSGLGLLFGLLLLEYVILTTEPLQATPVTQGLILGGTSLLLLPVLQAPGIIAALMVLGLGYHRKDYILLGLAAAFLVIFMSGFYYQLHFTLLTKSIMLMGTGLAFLVAYLIVSQRGKQNEMATI